MVKLDVVKEIVASDAPISLVFTAESSWFRDNINRWRAEIGIGVALLLLVAALAPFATNFFTIANLVTVTRQVSVTAMVAVCMTFVIITGEIDLSVGAMLGLSGVVFSYLVVTLGVPVIISLVATLAMAAAVGACVGGLRVRWGIPSFITTLGLLSILRGAAILLSDGVSIGPAPTSIGWLWYGDLLQVPIPIVVMIAAIAIGWITLSSTRFGTHLYAIGANPSAAARYGVSLNRLRLLIFIILHVATAFGSVMIVARLNSGNATVGELFELDVIAAVIIGGTSLSGGRGTIVGTLLGVLFVAVLRNGMLLMGVNPIMFMIAQGAVIVFAVWWSMLRRTPAQMERGA